jgi:hypothetical protein
VLLEACVRRVLLWDADGVGARSTSDDSLSAETHCRKAELAKILEEFGREIAKHPSFSRKRESSLNLISFDKAIGPRNRG